MMAKMSPFLAMSSACVLAATGLASVNIQTVAVAKPGNVGELSGEGAGGVGPDRICGGVEYAYQIGKFEVTAGQYVEFLNAVADIDPHGLYNTSMWLDAYGCKIKRSGVPGSYTYGVGGEWADRPVNYVSWGDAARFANWLHNGRPTGPQNATTTEDGAYLLDGAMSDAELLAIVRKDDAIWALPTEDEWYKAAYYDPTTGAYYDYPTGADAAPSNDAVNPDPGNNATFEDGGYTIGSPCYRTVVGAHENSQSPSGTFDQGGNVWEWNEASPVPGKRGLRGGSFFGLAFGLSATGRFSNVPTLEYGGLGFRVVQLPEPTALLLFGLAALRLRRR